MNESQVSSELELYLRRETGVSVYQDTSGALRKLYSGFALYTERETKD